MWSRIEAARGDEVEVAAAGGRHRLEEHLVEVLADPERRRGDAPGAQLPGVPGELVAVGDPHVGEAVGEEEAAVDALVGERLGDLLGAPQPALAEVRRAAGVDCAEPVERGSARVGSGERAGHDHVDVVVVGDDREPVVVVEAGDRLLDGLLGEADLLAAHRARSVEDEGEVDRRSHPLRSRGRCRDLDEDEAVAPVGGADERRSGRTVEGHGWSSSRSSRAISIRRSTRLCARRPRGRRT